MGSGAVGRRRVGRPAGAEAGATRREILRTARSAFAGHGYDATTVRSLADAAGVTQPTIYHHFGSKAGLFAAAYGDADQRLVAAIADAAGAGTTLTDRLGAMVDVLDALHADDPTIAGMLSVGQIETARSPELAAARGALPGTVGLAVPVVLQSIVDEAIEAGELPADADRDGVVALLTAMTLGVAMFTTVIDPGAHGSLLASWRQLVGGRLLPRVD